MYRYYREKLHVNHFWELKSLWRAPQREHSGNNNMYTKRKARLQCMWQITIQHCEYMQQSHNSLRIVTNEMTGRKGGGRNDPYSEKKRR